MRNGFYYNVLKLLCNLERMTKLTILSRWDRRVSCAFDELLAIVTWRDFEKTETHLFQLA